MDAVEIFLLQGEFRIGKEGSSPEREMGALEGWEGGRKGRKGREVEAVEEEERAS